MIPGIDLAGRVIDSRDGRYVKGVAVLVNGWGIGESYWGGLAQRASLKSEWLSPIPREFNSLQTMAIGTAGYTAMLAVIALERHGVQPDNGAILVTGAAGGVGGVAIVLLARLGYRVVAVTGRVEESAYLKNLGATEVLDRAVFAAPGKSLAKEKWAAAIDCAGSHTLANMCAQVFHGGIIAACGLAQGMDLPASMAPFVLRGLTLRGIDSVYRPFAEREEAWRRLAVDLDLEKLSTVVRVVGLSQVIDAASDLLAGRIRGRIVVDVNQ
jgi:acrylyl-CoA reductase (NADPH)